MKNIPSWGQIDLTAWIYPSNAEINYNLIFYSYFLSQTSLNPFYFMHICDIEKYKSSHVLISLITICNFLTFMCSN